MIKIRNSKPSCLQIDVFGLEREIFSYENLNQVFYEVKRRYFIDFIDKFPVGYDKERLLDFLHDRDSNLNIIRNQLKSGKYEFSPFMERKIPKSHKKALVLCQGCLRDVIVQIAINRVLIDKLQPYFSKGLYSSRKKGASINIHKLFKEVYKFHKDGKRFALKLDVEDYFNQIDRKILETQIQNIFGEGLALCRVIKSYIESPRAIKGRIVKRKKGIHIGSHLASLLANLYLTDFDNLILDNSVFYARYADDIFVIDKNRCKTDELLEVIREELKKYSLKINQDKLKFIDPGVSFEYLGFKFKYGNVYIRPKSIRKFKNKVNSCIRRKRYDELSKIKDRRDLGQEKKLLLAELVMDLNNLIAGCRLKSWVRYFAKVSFADQFRDLDEWIKDKLRQKLSGDWTKKNYRKFPNSFFRRIGLRSLVREYYGWHERWRESTRPLINKIASISNLEKSLDYYLTEKNLRKNREVQKFLLNKKKRIRIVHELLLNGNYKFHKPFKKEIKRFDTKEKRFIFTSCLEDRVVQRAVMNIIPFYFNNTIHEDVYSYRKGSSVLKAIAQVIRLLRNRGEKLLFKSDFDNFHQSIDLAILKEQILKLLEKYPSVCSIFDNFLDSLTEVEFLPKGMPLTNFLLNIYLASFDKDVSQRFEAYIRYADDFIVFYQRNIEKGNVKGFIQEQANKLGLKLKKRKSRFIERGGFEFLGYKFTLGKEFKISISDFTKLRLKRKIRRLTNQKNFAEVNIENYEDNTRVNDLIKQINYYFSTKKRASWSKYYCRVNDFAQIREIDNWINNRIRLCITKRTHLKDRRLISDIKIRKIGLVSVATWIYRAKKLMYNKTSLSVPCSN